jgi:hypothetical protein
MFATAPATARPARSSRGKEMMRTTRPPVVDGLSLALQAASSDTSTSTTARIQASYGAGKWYWRTTIRLAGSLVRGRAGVATASWPHRPFSGHKSTKGAYLKTLGNFRLIPIVTNGRHYATQAKTGNFGTVALRGVFIHSPRALKIVNLIEAWH